MGMDPQKLKDMGVEPLKLQVMGIGGEGGGGDGKR